MSYYGAINSSESPFPSVSPTPLSSANRGAFPTMAAGLTPGGGSTPRRVGSSSSLNLMLGGSAVDTTSMHPDVQEWEWPGEGVIEYINDIDAGRDRVFSDTFPASSASSSSAGGPPPVSSSSAHSTVTSTSSPGIMAGRVSALSSPDSTLAHPDADEPNFEAIKLIPPASHASARATKSSKTFSHYNSDGSDTIKPIHKKLGQLAATAIAGNDITGSCLYTLGICTSYAGIWAPVSLALVVIMLYFFRAIYAEVVTALPVNGGTYSVLLNTSSKIVAALAACLTILSYISTAVVSAASSMDYIQGIWSEANLTIGTIVILGIFCVLALLGIKESAPVAVSIFLIHLTVLAILIVDCFVVASQNSFQQLVDNWNMRELPNIPYPDIPSAIYYGFCAAMLGITGFETSANYVEEQKPGVFVKTLRNMWIAVGILNPTLSLMSLSVVDLPTAMGQNPNATTDGSDSNSALLLLMAQHDWLKKLVAVDAALVLCGGVFTSYVGITGLIRRLALDRCLPSILVKSNPLTKTNHFIIIGFFLLCTSLYLILDGNLRNLSGIYNLSFLIVMGLFAFGNLLLKYSRSKLHRSVRAPIAGVLLALSAVSAAFVGNVILNTDNVKWFTLYYVVSVLTVVIMLRRTFVLKLLLRFLLGIENHPVICCFRPTQWALDACIQAMRSIKSQKMVFLVKTDDITVMNKATMYVRDNEHTMWLQFVHVYSDPSRIPPKLAENTRILDRIYPKMRLDFVAVYSPTFDGETINRLSRRLEVPKQFIFMACPGEKFTLDIAELGGVRLITH